MRILVINSGSSTIKFSVFAVDMADAECAPQCVCEGEMSGIGEPSATLEMKSYDAGIPTRSRASVAAKTQVEAIELVFDIVSKAVMGFDAVGYRVVHPGAKLVGHQKITEEVLQDLEAASAFAPLHDPSQVALIREGMKRFPNVPHFACFDTEFHRTMSEEASIYTLPASYREQGVRRYGFHGLSYESVVRQMRADGAKLPQRMVIAHLGSGCSVTAVFDGKSIDTTMGLTPTGGVVMGTRPGDLDPGTVLYLLRQQKGDAGQAAASLEAMLNHDSGMVALTGLPNDMKLVMEAAADGNAQCLLALKVFARSVTKAIGGYCWLMAGLDAIAFAGGIGENVAEVRAEILSGLDAIGIALDPALNAAEASGMRRISTLNSGTEVFIVPAQEDLMIAVHVCAMVGIEQ